jgi:hypothetical protein
MPSIIHDLELSVRTTNVLNAMGTVQTYDDFMALTKEQVLSLKGLGTKAWHEIREVQQNIGRDPWQEPAPTEDLTALRDQAALAALPAIIQACAQDTRREMGAETHEQMFARKAWAVADAFIAAREGKTE